MDPHTRFRSLLRFLGSVCETCSPRAAGRHWLLTAAAVICFGLTVASARAANPNLLYQPLASFAPAPTAVLQTALADVNGDGKADLIRLVNGGQVSVQFGNGDGTFGTASFYAVGSLPFILVVADVTNDSYPDIIVGNSDGSRTVSVLVGSGNGTFLPQIANNIGLTATALAVTDFDKDGKLDLIATGYVNSALEGYISTLVGNASGSFGNLQTFPASARSFLTETRDVAVADLNNDSYPDFIVTAPRNGLAVISYLNNHNGTFTRAYEMLLNNVGRLALADFNADGKVDLAATIVSDPGVGQTAAGGNVAVAMGNGDGSFGFLFLGPPLYSLAETATVYGAGSDTRSSPASSIAAADMDGDGVRDLVIVSKSDTTGANYAAVLRGAANGTFTLGNRRQLQASDVWAAVGDLNGDGALDFVATPNSADTRAYLAGNNVVAPAFTSAASTSFIRGRNNAFTVQASGNPAPTVSLSGALPSGVTFTGGSLLSGIPAAGTEGVYPLTFTATNVFGQAVAQTFTLTVSRVDLVVTTAVDEDNGTPDAGTGAGASLREVINFANTLSGPQTVVFTPSLAGENINLTTVGDTGTGASALRINADITIQGLTGESGVTIRNASASNFRLFVVSSGAMLTLNDLTLADGRAGSAPGGAIYNRGTLQMNRCTLRNNSANNGGALTNGDSGGQTATLVNCTIANNQATGQGGGIQNATGATLNLTYCTVMNNTLPPFSPGAGLNNLGTATLVNTLVYGNYSVRANGATDSADIGGALQASSHHNYIEEPSGGLVDGVNGNIIDLITPPPGSLAARGGPTQTIFSQGPGHNSAAAVAGVTTDQRGVLRPQNGAPDIGAYEFDGTLSESLLVTTGVDETDGTSDPGFGDGTSLREALTYAASRPGPSTITFALPPTGDLISLKRGWNGASDPSALRVAGQVTFRGPTDRRIIVSLSKPLTQKRALLVEASGDLRVSNLTFQEGVADYGGSIANLGRFTVRSCTFFNNHATQDGGAIHSATSALSLLVENCTFSSNSSDLNASALSSGTADGIFRHLTITGNSGGSGAMTLFQNAPTMINSLVAANAPDGILAQAGGSFGAQSRNNLLGPGGSGSLVHGVNGNLVGLAANQLFLGPLAGNGGPTDTVALLANSPAVNAGTVLSEPSTDQRGISRAQGPTPDIGAYEFVIAPPVFTSGNRALFAANKASSFTVTATSAGTVSFTLDGQLPSGVTFTPAGLLSGTPAVGAVGDYPVTITATALGVSTTQSFTLTVSIFDFVVTTAVDENDGSTNPTLGTGTSLREAINFAMVQSQPQTIGFEQSLAGQTINLTMRDSAESAFSIVNGNANITIQGLVGSGGITISRGTTADLRFFQTSANLTLNDLTFSNGRASSGSGGAIDNQGTLRMNRCTMVGNSADRGGAISSGSFTAFQRPLFLTNCTFVNNTASTGGGAIQVFTDSPATLTNVTIANNSAGFIGGGLFASAGPAVVLINSIIARNTLTAGGASDLYSNLGFAAASHHNLIGTGGGGLANGVNGNLVGVQDPQLGTLASNGGPTQTLALLGGPAINGGATVSGVTTDQRGVTRPQYGTPDIGAYEFVGTLAPSIVVTTAVDEADVTSDPRFGTGTSLREALAYAQTLGGAPTITFAAALSGQTVTLTAGATGSGDDTALRNAVNLTIDGGTGVTLNLAATVPRRLFAHSAGTLSLRNLTLSGGDIRTAGDGGALYNTATVSVTNVRFTNNRANNGGAVLNAGTMSIASSTFDANATAANGQGGAICSNSTLGITGSTFSQNSATVLGGAIASFNGLTVSNCNFSTNHSDFNGGAVRLDGIAAISGSTFSNNTATNGGGAIMSHGATTLTNVTVAYNTALDGGGIQFFDGVPSVRHATIAYNTATRFGGGIAVNSANVTLKNTLVAANAETASLGSFNAASSNNLLNLTDTQAGLGSFGNNGGPNATIALLAGSPAINAGAVIAGLTTDQRGLARSVGSAPDIGALEDAVGDDDPDRDSLTNFVEFQLTTNPLLLDTDGDGFNDATETLNGSAPKLATSFPGASRIERVLGLGPARGLDLTGNFLYAVNVGTNGAPGQIGDANFTADSVAGVTITATQEAPNWAARDFGSTAEEDRLEQVFRSIRWDGPSPGVKVDAANLVPGRTYKLQLLFADGAGYDRAFDVTVNGTKIIPLYNTNLAQGANLKAYAASAIVHTFTAPTSALNVTLSNTSTGTFDPNPILNGFTLEEIPTAAQAWRLIHGLPADGSQDFANPSGDGVDNLQKYAFNLAPNPGDLLHPNVGVLASNGAAGLPAIGRDAQGRLVIEFVRRKAATQPAITYLVETGADVRNLQPLDLSGAAVVSIDVNWERVTVTDPVITPGRFGRVRVTR